MSNLSEINNVEGSFNLKEAPNPAVYWAFVSKQSGTIKSGAWDECEVHLNDLEKDTIIQVSVTGSAEKSGFYYEIVDKRKNAISSFHPQQIIWQEKKNIRWRSLSAQGIFRVKEKGDVTLAVRLTKGDVSGKYNVFRLSLVATILGIMKH